MAQDVGLHSALSALRLMEVHHDPPDRGGSVNSFSPLTPEDEYLTVTPKFESVKWLVCPFRKDAQTESNAFVLVRSDTITVYLSAMYAKLLFTLGIAFPILETISADGKYYQVSRPTFFYFSCHHPKPIDIIFLTVSFFCQGLLFVLVRRNIFFPGLHVWQRPQDEGRHLRGQHVP